MTVNYLGLSKKRRNALIRTLARDHVIGLDVAILDMEHKSLGSLNGKVTGGQVNIDADADITRQLQMTFIDEKENTRVDMKDGRAELRRMIRVRYRVLVGDEWISIPIFTGPITSVSREEGVVTLEAMGKEHLILGPTWRTKEFPKGTNRVSMIRVLMRDITGERRMALPKGWRSRTAKPNSLTKEKSAWNLAQAAARGARAQLYYDGRGVLRLRHWPIRSAFTFRDGDGGMLLTVPTTSENNTDIINTVKVVGAVPKGKKKPLTVTKTLPRNHPHSPWQLGRNGVPRYLPEQIDDDSLRTQKDVDRVAERRLTEIQLDEQIVTFDSLPMPLLEPGDRFTIDAKGAKGSGRISQMTIPLTHDGVSTIGYLAPASKRKR